MTLQYFYLEDRLNQTFHAAVPRFTNIVRPGGCRDCGFVPIGVPPPSPLVVRPEPRKMRSVLPGTSWGFCVARMDFLEALGNDVRSHLLLGTLQLESGEPVEQYRTVRARELVILRDGERAVHRICPLCGALRYTPWPAEPVYVLESSVRSAAPIYEVEAESFLIRRDIRERLGDRWAADGITFREIPIAREPRDGLPADLPNSFPRQFLPGDPPA